MNFKFILTILICLISLYKSIKNESCLEWLEWKVFKSDFRIRFHNSTLESIAYLNSLLIIIT